MKTGSVHLSADWAILLGHVCYPLHTPTLPDQRVGVLGPCPLLLCGYSKSIPMPCLWAPPTIVGSRIPASMSCVFELLLRKRDLFVCLFGYLVWFGVLLNAEDEAVQTSVSFLKWGKMEPLMFLDNPKLSVHFTGHAHTQLRPCCVDG